MKVLITGGAGFLGQQLARTLLQRKELQGDTIDELVIADLAQPAENLIRDSRVKAVVGPLMDNCPFIAKEQFGVAFHLAGAVSAECEASFDLGLRSNLDTTRAVLDTLRASGRCPRLVFASSVAVFGGDAGLPLPKVIHDDTLPIPQSSYGIQKFICEQLVADYTRKGFIDGRPGRLMTVAVRSGRPNAAASGFLSSIVREPLLGREAICPVPLDVAVALASPKNTVHGLITLAEADSSTLGGRTAINFPALRVTVGEILEALEKIGGKSARERVKFQADPVVAQIVAGWPSVFDSQRALRLGLRADPDILSIVQQFVDDNLAEYVREQPAR